MEGRIYLYHYYNNGNYKHIIINSGYLLEEGNWMRRKNFLLYFIPLTQFEILYTCMLNFHILLIALKKLVLNKKLGVLQSTGCKNGRLRNTNNSKQT